jgi:aspartyl protease family protein
MKLQDVFWICIGCILLVAISRYAAPSPTFSAASDNAPIAVNASPAPAPAQSITAEPVFTQPKLYSNGNGITLQRESDGHFYANANIQGRDIRFLVDTGASAIALTGRDAEALGLYWNPGELTKIGRGVSGDVMGKPVIIPSIQVGDLHAENVQAAIIPEGLDVSLLGQSFLSKVGTVNISNDKMTLQ